MKDSRFTELVNLYIDRQISPDEQAELELEIQSNPRRRQVYLQYCRMHRATKLVYESFRAQTEQPGQPARQPATIAHIQGRIRQRRLRWAYAASGLAAAACVAFVVMRSNLTDASSASPDLAAARTTPAAPAVAVAAQPAPAPVRQETPRQTELAAATLTPRDYTSILASLRQEEQSLLSLQNGSGAPRLNSLFDDGVFDERAALQNRANNLPNRKNPRLQTEFTAFQFQR
ncbi:MAG TPA: hypothetical protein VK477_12575 [Acidobacteriota bacterium]|nr:hypothetical protein [Acidobacteriota bacterium]